MTSHEHDDARPDSSEGGQVSEAAVPEPEVGGADATDKSTGTAPDEAGETDHRG